MDENLRKAARTGKVNELYRVIQRNENVLRRVDEVEFMETPLHIAAEEGCIEFAMEMMNLKPSFARKLNHQFLHPKLSIEQVLKLLLNCKADKHATNQVGLTALGVAQQHNNRENMAILQGYFISVVSNFKRKLEKQVVKYVTKASLLIFQNMDNISADDRNALLVILGLLLTATYQATLSPPGGVWQGENTSKSKGSYEPMVLGKSVMDPSDFLLFYIPTYLVFLVTLFLTLALLKTFPHDIRTALQEEVK
ncbi:hypothetical protein GOBAR_AA33437 [Gossypium barbadense]|uniref:PGG domain-containing protein n=1 Tax=Gossypium barbadense TaxID=3634 RepID=A0A2P5W832_GOSBA|nr:hypothetical protein GOBAR_AA33437 [Gossypium barbadense]